MKPKKSLFSRGGQAAAFVTAVTFCVTGHSFAAEYDWSAATADFNNPANWTIGGNPAAAAPGSLDIARVANGGNAQWTANAAKTILEIHAGNGAAGTVSISGGNSFTSTNGALVGRQNGVSLGTLNVSGAGTIFNVTSGNTHVGTVSHNFGTAGAGATGVLDISAGAVFNHQPNGDESFIIGNNLPPANTPVQAGTYKGTLNVNGGTLNILNGSRLYVGQSAGSEGEMNVSSGGTVTVADDHLIIGRGGKGTLNFSGGTINKNGGGTFAAGDLGGTSVVNQTGGTLNVAGGEFRVGQGGGSTGTYTLGAGAAINTNFWTTIGREGGTGTFNLEGGTITKNASGEFMVGAFDGGPSNGTFNQNSGTVDVASGQLWVGQGGNPEGTSRATGTYNLDGGSVNVNNWVAVGRERGNGTMNISGTGKLTKTGNNDNHFVIGQGNSGNTGTLTVTEQGVLDIKAGQLWVSEDSAGSATLSGDGIINASAVQVARFAAPSGGGELNLNGGTLKTGRIFGGSGNSTVNFGGTSIVATANENFFIENFDTLAIQQAGGLKIDSATFNLTIGATRGEPNVTPPQILSGPGGITKAGAGTLSLVGAHTYAGPTVISGGKLSTTTAAAAATGAISVAKGASLGVSLLENGKSIAPSAFTITEGTIDINFLDYPRTTVAPIDVKGVLTLNGTAGTTVINIASNTLDELTASHNIPLLRYTGNLAGSAGFPSVKVGTLPVGVKGVIIHDADNKTIKLDITRVAIPTWRGYETDAWNLADHNWDNSVGAFEGEMAYVNGDPVLFPDDADLYNVKLPVTVTPGEYVLFQNSSNSYTLSGAGKISGTTRLIKRGTAPVTLSTAANDFTGGVLIEEGSVVVNSLPNGGAPSPIGAATAAPANLLLSGGSLNYTGGNATSNRGFTVGAAGGGISVTNAATNLTLSGTNASTAGGLVKKGAGTLTLTGSGAIGSSAPVQVQEGKLAVNGTGTNPAQAVTVGELWVGSTPDTPATFELTAGTLSTNNWMAIGRGNGNSGHISTVNVTNATLNVVNFSTGYANGLANNSIQNITFSGATFNNTAETKIAESPGSTTNITISNGSTLNTREIQVALGGGPKEGASAATITLQNNSTWNVGTEANIAYASIGRDSGTGNLIVKDTAKFINFDDFTLAEAGPSTGTLTIQDSGAVTIRTGLLGRGPGGTGLVNQSGGSLTALGNSTAADPFDFEIGVAGNATYNLTGGTVTTNGRTGIARDGASVSSLNISGGTFTHTNTAKLFHVGTAGNGTLSVSSAGQLNILGGFYAGTAASGVGNINQTGGVINASRNVILGDFGRATVNLSGGQFSMNTGGGAFNFIVGNKDDSAVTVNISSNADVKLMNNASLRIGNETSKGSNAVVQTGGSVTFYGDSGTTVGGTGGVVIGRLTASGLNSYELAGGTLSTGSVIRAADATAGSSVLKLNGGLLKATQSNATFVHNLAAVQILAGGARIDSNSFDVAVTSPMTQDVGNGGLTKTGTGTLTLSGANTYSGDTNINAGGITLAPTGQLRFYPGASGVNNKVTGTGTATLNGGFVIQGSSTPANGSTWTLVNSSVNETYGASFTVSLFKGGSSIPFSKSGTTWTLVDGGNTWTFSESTGVLSVATGGVADPYTTWTSTYFPGVTDQNIIGRNADPDGDGSSNALEFALGGAPNDGANNPKVYSLQADGSADGDTDKELLLTIAVRAGTPTFTPGTSPTASKDGVTYTIQGSLDLTGFTTGVTEVNVVAPVTPQNPPNGYEYRTFSLNGSNNLNGKGFLRVRVN